MSAVIIVDIFNGWEEFSPNELNINVVKFELEAR